MAFSFEPFLAISAGHFMAVSAGPEQCLTVRHISFVAFPMVSCYNLLATQFNKTSFGEVRFCFGKNASPALHFSKEVKAASRQGS